MSIYELESKMYMFIRYRSNSTKMYSEGKLIETFDFDIERFMKYIDGKLIEAISMEEFKQNSVIYDNGIQFFLYNQDDFSIQNNKLFVSSTILSPIHHGGYYRFNDSLHLRLPNYDHDNRAYLLNECSEVIHLYNYDVF